MTSDSKPSKKEPTAEDNLKKVLSKKPEPVVAPEDEVGATRRRVPLVKMKTAGKVSRTLEGLAVMFRAANPDMACRWVYSPEHKKELSNVLSRKSDGYQEVFGRELGSDAASLINEEEVVRVSDVILMKISSMEREELKEELAGRAQEQAEAVEAKFYDTQEDFGVEDKNTGTVHRGVPRGRVVIEERDHVYDVEQRTSEGG